MHTSEVLRSHHFRVVDRDGAEIPMTGGLTVDDRLGIVSPRYEDGILGAGPAILAFITAYYDLQRAREQETGEPFFVYADYYAFLFADGSRVRGQGPSAPLDGAVSSAYGWLDVWPAEKWVVVQDAADLWAQVAARGVTHLLLPIQAVDDVGVGAVPETVAARLTAIYRYLLPGEAEDDHTLRIELGAEPRDTIAEAVRRLPPDSPAHAVELPAHGALMIQPGSRPRP